MSARSRGEEPNAVALRSDPGQKSVSASAKIFSSTRILDSAYEVTGRGRALADQRAIHRAGVSVEEALDPCRLRKPGHSRVDACWLMSQVI
jgi:hypothetical protein